MKKHFCTRCLKHFMEERSLQQHAFHCKNEVEPGNLIDALRDTGGYSKEVRKATIIRMRRYLQRIEVEEKGATIKILNSHQIYYYLNIYYRIGMRSVTL